MASKIKVDQILGSTGDVITVPTGQTLTVTDGLPVASGGTGIASFTAGDILYATGATTLTKLNKGTAEQVLAMNSGATAPDWGSVDVSVGGTGIASFTAGDILYATGATTLTKLAKGAAADLLTMNSGATAPEWAASAGGGITEADSWRLTTGFAGDAAPIASNLERSDTAGQGNLGTGMAESAGIFTFPSTGWWSITFQGLFNWTASTDYFTHTISTTVNDSSYVSASYNSIWFRENGATVYSGSFCSTLFDVTSTSTHKVRFDVDTQNASALVTGSSTVDTTSMKFIKLGDT